MSIREDSPRDPEHDPATEWPPSIVSAAAEPAPVSDDFAIGRLLIQRRTLDEASRWVVERALSEQPALVVTSNIFHLMLTERDADFAELVRGCDLNVADGWPLVFASRLLGPRLSERVTGIDLVARVLRDAPPRRVAVMGGYADASARFAERFDQQHHISVVDALEPGAWDTPSYRDDLRRRLRAARPNLVLVGIGAPRQEWLGQELLTDVAGPVICCGATIEVLADVRRRAPGVMRSTGLEWAYRMALEPRRLAPRYLSAGSSFVRIAGREVVGRLTRRRALRHA